MLKKIRSGAKSFVLDYKNRLLDKSSLEKLTMCKKCYTFYYGSSWHFEMPENLKKYPEEEVPVTFTLCSACRVEEEALYENEAELAFG